jgi:hypothetical protein
MQFFQQMTGIDCIVSGELVCGISYARCTGVLRAYYLCWVGAVGQDNIAIGIRRDWQ